MKQLVKQSIKKYINLKNIFAIFILFIILVIASNPPKYISAALNGLEVWAKVLLPSLFPFFVLTKLFSSTGFIDDFTILFEPVTKKLYKCPKTSSYIFLMSIITGYPVGAKLVSENYESGNLSKTDAIKTLSFCCNSGPMFILGSVAIGMFANKQLGIIIYISHIIGALLNGILYRNYNLNKKDDCYNNINNIKLTNKINMSFNESINSSLSSILLIGGVICFTFVIIEFLTSNAIFNCFINTLSFIGIDKNIISAFFSGLCEITKGCLMFSVIPISYNTTALICTFIISLGGISTFLQAVAFTKDIVPIKTFILQKITHALCATLVCFILLLIF